MRRGLGSGTPNGGVREFLQAAELRTRMEVRKRRAQGLNAETIRVVVAREFDEVIADDLLRPMAAPIMERVRRTIEDELKARPAHPGDGLETAPRPGSFEAAVCLN